MTRDDDPRAPGLREVAEERWRRMRARIDARLGRPLLTVGLTGGIASGKSTVDALFAELGAGVIDADAIVHELLGPGGAAVRPVLDAFGPDVGLHGGGVDRGALGAIVFGDSGARARLEAIVHPLVTEEIDRRIEEISRRPGPSIVLVDAALLVETGDSRRFDRLVVVTCSEPVQVERLMSARGLGKGDAIRRVRAQLPSEDKAALADYRIDNDADLAALRARVREVHRSLLSDFERKKERWSTTPPRR